MIPENQEKKTACSMLWLLDVLVVVCNGYLKRSEKGEEIRDAY